MLADLISGAIATRGLIDAAWRLELKRSAIADRGVAIRGFAAAVVAAGWLCLRDSRRDHQPQRAL
jgi:hypothetical protein